MPVVVAGRPVGTLVVRVPQGSVSTVDKEFHSSVNRLLVAGALIAALVALLVGVYTARRATKPITELTSAAGTLAAGHRDRRASTVPNNEIGQLAKAFNTMVEHLVKRINCAALSPRMSPTSCARRWQSFAVNSRPCKTEFANPPTASSAPCITKPCA